MSAQVEGQLWIRAADGQTWGPLPAASARVMLARAQAKGVVLVSTDGEDFLQLADHPEAQLLLGELGGTSAQGPVVAPPPAPAPPPAVPAPPPPIPEGPPPGPQTGKLEETSAVRLYASVAAEKATARLVFQEGDRRVDIYFKRGVPEAARCTDPALSFGGYLLARGAIRPAQLAAAERMAGGGPLEGALVATGAVTANDLFQHLSEHGRTLLDAALAMEKGTWRKEPFVAPPPGSFALGPAWGLLCESVRRWPREKLERALGPRRTLPVFRADGGVVQQAELKLTAQEARAAALFNGAMSVEQLAARTPAEAEAILRTAWLLFELELVKFAGEEQASDAGAKAAAEAATAARKAADDLKSLRAAHQGLAEKDHFQVLGVDRKAPPEKIKASYFALARAYHPDTVGEGAPPEVKKMKEELFARVNEAYEVLSDEKKRANYLAELEFKATGINPEAVLKSEEIFSRATIVLKARKYEEALPMLEEAIKLYPNEGEYYAWRGYCKFLMAKDKRALKDEAMAEIRKATELNQKCAVAYLFAGRIAKVLGDTKAAEMHFRKCLQIDPKQSEAESELRVLARQKG